MSYLSKLKKSIFPCGPLIILSLFLMGADRCKKAPWGTVMFYDQPNCVGKCFVAGFNNSSGSIKWDNYDFAASVGDNSISSFKIFVNKPTTLILCENEHFKGRYLWVNVKSVGNWTQVNSLSANNFNDITSSIIVTHEEPGQLQLIHTRIELVAAVEAFWEGIKEEFKSNDKVEAISRREAQILWDTKLNYLTKYKGYSYSPSYETYKNSDLIKFYAKFDLDPNWWPADYEVRLEFWLEPTKTNGVMGFKGYAWAHWVEDGMLHDKISSGIKSSMPEALADLAKKIDAGIREKMGPLAPFLTSNIERISFTQPRPGDTSMINLHAGGLPWRIESTPPIIILERKEAKTAAAPQAEDQTKEPVIPDKSISIKTEISGTGEKSSGVSDKAESVKIAEKLGPEITNNIKKLGFKDEKEYREKLLNDLGISKEDEKKVKILQMTYNGVPGVSVTGLTSMDDLSTPTPDKLQATVISTNPKEVVAELKALLKKMEASSSITISQINRLIALMNEATRLGVMKPEFLRRFENLIINKTEPYRDSK